MPRHTARSGSSALRLFVGVYPPEHVVRAMLDALASIRSPAHRVTPAEQVHLTLQFIGNISPREIESVRESVDRSVSGVAAFEASPLRYITLPQKGPARLIAVETSAPAELLEIQRRLASRLARDPREHSGDGFLPHITFCRFKSPADVQVDQACEAPAFRVESVRLMRSVLTPAGAIHACMHEARLGP